MELKKRALAERLASIEEERRNVINEAREQAELELDAVRERLRRVETSFATPAIPRDRLIAASEQLNELEKKVIPLSSPRVPVAPPPRDLRVGDTVWISTLNKTGEIAVLGEQGVQVTVGGFRLEVPLNALELRHRAPVIQDGPRVRMPARASPGIELHLRGWRAEDAIPRLDKYLDDAYLAGLPYIRIIHGKGTGTLRRVVREQLANHPLVKSFRPGDMHEGGEGATIAVLIESQASMTEQT
jgi:DNA mismatch repair protein MutS2